MNKYDERYTIRLANISDVDDIMQFINKYWENNHIMSIDKKLFMYEFGNAYNDKINFILAIDKKTKSLEGIFGFINCSNTKDYKKRDIWGSMWMVNNLCENTPLLGIELAKRVYNLTFCRTHIGNGANPKTTIPLRRLYFGEKTARMKHYYYLNPHIQVYKIAVVRKRNITLSGYLKNQTFLKELKSIEDVKDNFDVESIDVIPFKDNWYINKRYFSHPYYKYKVYGVADSTEKIKALIMMRSIEFQKNKVLRIVDYIGEQKQFAGLKPEFDRLLKENTYEYVDFYTYGFDEEYILNCGFISREDNGLNIIPNYFEPFLQKNIDIWVHYKFEGTLFFKADGDQDRPNICLEVGSNE